MNPGNPAETNWDSYYQKPYRFAGMTKGIIIRRLRRAISRYLTAGSERVFLEFGGGNSCFYLDFMRHFNPDRYIIVDNNQHGLSTFARRFPERANTTLIQADILDHRIEESCDLVFSVGLIEHFDQGGTKQAIQAHFEVLKPGGLLILGFPTPTWLYRVSRRISERLGLWIFPDERPLRISEVEGIISPHGVLLHKSIIWPIFLTQALLIIRKS